MILILPSVSFDLELWPVNYASIYENFELNVFINIKFLGKISSNWSNELLGLNVYKALELCWQSLLTILKMD